MVVLFRLWFACGWAKGRQKSVTGVTGILGLVVETIVGPKYFCGAESISTSPPMTSNTTGLV